MLQVGRSRVRFPVGVIEFFFNLSNPFSSTIAVGLTQPLTEMSTRDITGAKERPVRKADNLTVVCETLVYKMWDPGRLTTL
jgi:hypothetical protein